MEILSPGDQIQTLLSSAGTKVYNLCHGVTEAPGERQLSPFPEPSTNSMAGKAKTTIFSPDWGDPVPGFQPELPLATSSRQTLAACPYFWAAQLRAALSGFQTSQIPSLPCLLQAVRPLPMPTTCARGQSHLCLCCSGKALSSALPLLHFCPPAAYFAQAVTFRMASRDWERVAGNKLGAEEEMWVAKCSFFNMQSTLQHIVTGAKLALGLL